jgi:uncharacterized membrane protein
MFCFFVASILLREKHFRYVAMAGIVFCVFRLVVHDLSRSDMLVRGLVFTGIGIVLLVMYSLYNRFRGRFE